MDLRDQLNEAFKERNCTTEWLEDNAERKWGYNTQTFFEEGDGTILGPKTGKEIVDHIFSFEVILTKRHFVLMLHVLPEECVKGLKSVEDNEPVYVLYYDPQ